MDDRTANLECVDDERALRGLYAEPMELAVLKQLDHLDKHLKGREFLLDHFSVADAYLTTVLNWSMATPMIDFAKYPAVKDYLERMKKRPAVAKALAEEFELYKAEITRHKQAA